MRRLPGNVTGRRYARSMSGCTAPVYGHRTAGGRANCPVCRYGGSSYRSYPSYSPPPVRRSPVGAGRSSGGGGGGGGGGTRRLRGGRGTVSYSPAEWRTFEPVARKAEVQAQLFPQHRDLFLCHAWDDRQGAAKDLYDQLVASGATVWFSETEVGLGKSLLREIDRGLAMSRIGIVLATPALLESLKAQGVADKELSALLATDRVIPIAHGTTFEAVREVSPLLAARSGLTIDDNLPMEDAAKKIAAAAAAEGDGTTGTHTSREW